MAIAAWQVLWCILCGQVFATKLYNGIFICRTNKLMIKYCTIAAACLFAGLANATPPNDTAMLRQHILTEMAKQPQAHFAVAFKNLATGETFFIHAHDSFHAASTMKTPVLIETYKQAAEHKFALGDSILVHTTFNIIYDGSSYLLDSASDSEKDLYFKAGTKLPITELLFRMITKSSNLATNLMIELVGAKNVMGTLQAMGVHDIQVLRGVEDSKAFAHGMNNTVTAYGLLQVFEQIANGKAVSQQACDSMVDILEHQFFRDVIPAKLPPEVKVANKSGSITGVCHDSGIVFLPDGRKYVVVLLSKDIPDYNAAADILANVSKMLYDHVVGK